MNSRLFLACIALVGGLALLPGCATVVATAGSGVAGNLNTAILNQDDPELGKHFATAREMAGEAAIDGITVPGAFEIPLAARAAAERADILLWPESALPYRVDTDPTYRVELEGRARDLGAQGVRVLLHQYLRAQGSAGDRTGGAQPAQAAGEDRHGPDRG